MNRRMVGVITIICLSGLLAGCATGAARVLEVSAAKYRRTIRPENEVIFVRDRASKQRLPPTDLPDDEQRQEFYVRWTPATVRLVKFEYRQVGAPDKIAEKSFTPERGASTVFQVRGPEFVKNGVVTSWRVSLLNDSGEVLAQKQSALW